jgi:hydrogenase expression/formation protein HypD
MELGNFSIYAVNKTVPLALRALADDPQIAINALLLPGHVSTIIGLEPYEFLSSEFAIAGVIAGFEPLDILQGIYMLLQQLDDGRAQIEIAYARGVQKQGNPLAVATMNEVFEPSDATWRGLGLIPGTGLCIRDEFAQFDAVKRFSPHPCEPRETPGCACGDSLRGVKTPPDCRLFGKGCTPERPIGPCMVSGEGSCAAYSRYHR